MAWGVPRTWTVGEIVTAAMMNSDVRDNTRFLKGIDGTISIDAPLKGGTGSGTFYMEFESLVSASVAAIASATAGRVMYNSTDRQLVLTDATAHRSIPAVPRPVATGQIVVGVASGTFGLGTAPASGNVQFYWQSEGATGSGTWTSIAGTVAIATGQLVLGVASGTFGLGTAPASADFSKVWQSQGATGSGTWADQAGQLVALASGSGLVAGSSITLLTSFNATTLGTNDSVLIDVLLNTTGTWANAFNIHASGDASGTLVTFPTSSSATFNTFGGVQYAHIVLHIGTNATSITSIYTRMSPGAIGTSSGTFDVMVGTNSWTGTIELQLSGLSHAAPTGTTFWRWSIWKMKA